MSGQGVLPSRRVFFIRLARQALLSGAIVAFSLALGAAGYHEFVGLPWLDATLNASMILTGMGPVAPLDEPERLQLEATARQLGLHALPRAKAGEPRDVPLPALEGDGLAEELLRRVLKRLGG